jgi:tRNA 5-methylaminomethyl-2-thiouridine biosynthesis bifunctional protein
VIPSRWLPATPQSEILRTIVSANGYLAPSAGTLHVLGATLGFNDEAVDLRASDHTENLSTLADISPALAKSMNIDSLDVEQLNGRASVQASVSGAMPLVGELLPGLYTSLGHGTRGLITAGLSGELIAAIACGQLLSLSLGVVNALAPVPGLVG